KRHGTEIAEVTARRYMPPWLPQNGYGDFAEDRRLSSAQIRLIGQWVEQGAPAARGGATVSIALRWDCTSQDKCQRSVLCSRSSKTTGHWTSRQAPLILTSQIASGCRRRFGRVYACALSRKNSRRLC